LNYFVYDYFGFVLYCGYLVSLLLGSVSGWVAWVDFCFWIIYVLAQGLEIFEFGAMAILYSIMCYGVEIINFLELNSLLTLDRLLINLFYFWKGCLVFFEWVFGFAEFWGFLWVLSLGIFDSGLGFCVYCLSLG